MSGTYKLITLVGTSNESFADAVRGAVETASRSVRGLSWFEVDQLRGRVEGGRVEEYQVMLRAGFKVEGASGNGSKRSKRRSK